MNIEKSIYPYNPELAGLPFFLCGIGGSRYQSRVTRSDGYMWHQILYCADGHGVLRYGKNTEEIGPNTLIFLPKDVPHEYYPSSSMWEVNWIAFDGSACDSTFRLLEMRDVAVAKLTDPGHVAEIFKKMLFAQQNDILYCSYTCSAYVYDYIIAFHRLFVTEAENRRSRELSILLPAFKYIHENFAQNIQIPDLASLSGITHQHFCRLFKNCMNMRPGDYLTRYRIDQACRMLRDEDLSVSEIAERCGFNDACYFSTVFKKVMGTSPGRYRA